MRRFVYFPDRENPIALALSLADRVGAIAISQDPRAAGPDPRARPRPTRAAKGKDPQVPDRGVSGVLPLTPKAPAVIDCHKARKQKPEFCNLADLVLAWALASRASHWAAIASKLGKLATALATSDPDFSADLALLEAVARRHAIEAA